MSRAYDVQFLHNGKYEDEHERCASASHFLLDATFLANNSWNLTEPDLAQRICPPPPRHCPF